MQKSRPALILVGFGVDNGLQLTIEGQRAVSAAEHVYSIGLPEVLRSQFRSSRIPVTDLDDRFKEGDDYAAAYLDVADYVLKQAAIEPPVALLVPGNPMFQNTLSRFLVQIARQRRIAVQIFPSVSIVDALISDIGLDVTAGGLQIFDARRLVRRAWTINVRIPLFVLALGGLFEGADNASSRAESLGALGAQLGRFYPQGHAVTLVTRSTGRGEIGHSTVQLRRLADLAPHVTLSSALFVDVFREARSP
jgi:hypothetical protein